MKLYRPALLLIFILLITGCGDRNIKKESAAVTPAVSVIAVYKNFEDMAGGGVKLIFRRLDNLEYIIFQTDTAGLAAAGYPLVLIQDGIITVNNDYLNLKFEIAYTGEAAGDPASASAVYRLYSIKRAPGDRFSAAKIENDVEADDFLLTLKEKIRQNDANGISLMISYPVTVVINKKRIKITSPERFVNNFSQIFNQKVTGAVLNQAPADVRASSKGLMIGNGVIWLNSINGKIAITAINN